MPKGNPAAGANKRWTDADERRLLLIIIAHPSQTKDWDVIAASMGEGYTASAVSQKFNKIRKAAEEEFGGTGTTREPGSAKRKANSGGTPSSKTGTPKKGKSVSAAEGDEDDDEESLETPSKKIKVEPTEKANKSKGKRPAKVTKRDEDESEQELEAGPEEKVFIKSEDRERQRKDDEFFDEESI